MENINTPEYWDAKYKELKKEDKIGIGVNEDRRMWFQSLFVNPNDTILEIGCGDATFLKFMKKYGKKFGKYIGTEISPFIIEQNKIENPESDFLMAKMEIAPIDCEQVDKIYCMHVIEHIETPELYINQWMKNLKSRGMFIISVPYLDNPYPEHLRIYDERACDDLMAKIEGNIQYEFFIRRLGWRFPEDGRTAKELVMMIIKE